MVPAESAESLQQMARGLVRVLPALNRALDRRADQEFPFPKPPEVQMAMLSLVGERDGITVREAAEILLVKPTNASALVSRMVSAGLLRREQDPMDKRIVHLHITSETRTRIRDVDDLYSSYVTDGLDRLSEGEQDALRHALPALYALAAHIQPVIR